MLGITPKIQPVKSSRDPLLRVLDASCILAAFYLAERFLAPVQNNLYWPIAALAIVLFYLASEICNMYRDWRGAALEHEVARGWLTWAVTGIAILTVGFATGYVANLPRNTLFTWGIITPVLFACNRVAIRSFQRVLRSRGMNTRGYAIVGVNELGFRLARDIDQNPALGLKLIGFFDDRPKSRTPEVPTEIGRRIGNLDELVRGARSGQVEAIYITFPMRAEDRIRGVLQRLADSTATVYIIPDFFVFELLHARWTNIGGLPAVSVFDHPFYGVDGLVKRTMDLILAAFILLILAVPMGIVALLVKRSSPGPVLFRQRRYGLDGREIGVWKYRTMRVCEDGDKVTQATKDDNRITPIGRILRRTSIDELPQLLNVLLGHMSLVGPRPHATAHNEHYRNMIQGYMLRHKVKPGITGLAQVSGCRGETDTTEKMQQRIEYDHRYIREWSLWLDFKILFKTVLVVFSQENAY